MNTFKKLDIISNDATIYGHGNQKKIQNFFGALISIFCFILIGGAAAFFVFDFLNNSKPSVILSNSFADNYTVVDFQKIPYLFRLSNEFSVPDKNISRLYKPRMLWANTYLVNNTVTQNYTMIDAVSCDIDKHFDPKYREFLRNNIKDISSYSCPDYPKDIQLNLTGLYGGSKLYSYAFFMIMQCNTTDIKRNCYPQDYIDELFKNYYYDIIMLDYYIDHTLIPSNHMSIYSTRGAVTNKSRKKLKHKLKTVIYDTDFGLVFESKETVKFHQVLEYEMEILYDLPKQKFNDGSSSILSDYVINHNYLDLYSRSYMKAQQLLANLGGIFKAIMTIAQVIMFIFGDKISLLEVINTSYFIDDYKKESSKKLSENNESNIHIKKNNYVDHLNIPINKERELEIRQINNKIQVGNLTKVYEFLKERSKSKLKLKFFEKYFCLFSYSNDAKIYEKIVEEMKRDLNINNILINFKRYDSFISNYYSKEGNILFESLYKKGYISSKCLDDFENIFNKVNENTNDKDKRLLDIIETMLF